MSCNYAEGLSAYKNKGKLGLPEKFDPGELISQKVKQLAEWIESSQHVVIHTGAGISTSAGIPDFRGPRGVWTLEKKGEKPEINISFNDAAPTLTHMAIVGLVLAGKVNFVISQNIDGLHLKSGLPRKYLSELHGNMFIEQCNHCQRQFIRKCATSSVGQKCLEKPCSSNIVSGGRPCRGRLHDTILDWEHDLPEKDLELADFHSCVADLSICLGTTLQIIPSGNLPLNTKKYSNGRLVICNLQPTKHDKKADLIINAYVDTVLKQLMSILNVEIPKYNRKFDPTYRDEKIVEWTIQDIDVRYIKLHYEQKIKGKSKRTLKDKDGRKAKKGKTDHCLDKKPMLQHIKQECVDSSEVCYSNSLASSSGSEINGSSDGSNNNGDVCSNIYCSVTDIVKRDCLFNTVVENDMIREIQVQNVL